MKQSKTILLLFFFIVFTAVVSQNEGFAQDPGQPDTIYFSCGSDSSADGDTLYIPCNGTHDVTIRLNIHNDKPIQAFQIPLTDLCYGLPNYAYLDSAKNFDLDGSLKPICYQGSRFYNFSFVDVTYDLHPPQVLPWGLGFVGIDSGNGLLATLVYTVKDTGRICLDTLPYEDKNLELVDTSSTGYTPIFRADTFIIATRSANAFPVLTLPSDVDTAMTTPVNLCITGILGNDSDAGNTIILEKIEGPGIFVPDTLVTPGTIVDSICFLPEDTDSTYMFVFKLRDQCPAAVYDTFYVTVNISGYPYLTVPDDVDTFLCDIQSLCIDSIIATDPDTGDTIILEMLEGPGVFDPDTGVGPDSIVTSYCFIPANKDSTYRLIFQVTDSTQLSDEDTFYVAVDMEEPPFLSLPSDVDTCLPPAQTLCIKDITATDPDIADTIILEMVSGPGAFIPDTGLSTLSDSICFDPASNDSIYEFVFKVTDSCDSTRQDTFYVTVNVNEPSVITLPADIDTFLCDAQEICFDSLIAFDPDSGDTFIVEMIEGPGAFDPDTGVSPDSVDTSHCFTPADNDDTYRFIFEVTDPCGETDRDTLNVAVDINDPPEFSAPETLWVIENSAKFDTFTATDPEGHTIVDSAGITVDPDCGIYSINRISGAGSSGEWEISFSDTGCADSVFIMAIDLRDTLASCASKVAYDTIFVIIRSQTHYNNPPIVFAPGDTTVNVGDTLDLIFTAYDPDEDIILDTSRVFVPCGSTFVERLTDSGEPSGEWRVTFFTEGCSSGQHSVDLNLQDFLGAWGWDPTPTVVTLEVPDDVPETPSTGMAGFVLAQNYPNPFNLKTSMSFEIPYACRVNLKIYNLAGRLVNTLVDGEMQKGQHTIFWDGTSSAGDPVASGIYFYKLTASDFVSVKKMILLK